MHKSMTMLLALALLTGSLPIVGAEPLASYDLVGVDTEGDGTLPLASGAAWPACGTGFGGTKYDIHSLEMAHEPDAFHVKLNPGAHYAGTSSIMYVVHFTVGETPYLTCWNVQSGGTTTNS